MNWATTILLLVIGLLIGAHPLVTDAARPASIASAKLLAWLFRVIFVRLPQAAWGKIKKKNGQNKDISPGVVLKEPEPKYRPPFSGTDLEQP